VSAPQAWPKSESDLNSMNDGAIPLLIVDDDPVFARFVQQLVQALGHELPCQPSWVDSAEKAFEELGRNRYEVVLLDYNLPGANGLQVLAQVQQLPLTQQPAVIMLTASGNESVAVEAMKRGAKDYLPKVDLDVPPLMRAIKSALAQKRLAEQVARYNAQIQADLEMARKLQQSLLPQSYPSFPRSARPEDSALHFCHRYESAAELGGDFFHVLGLSDTQAGVFICDVMGHGVRSALVTAMLRALVDDLAPGASDPGAFLSDLNCRLLGLLRQTEGPLFATAFYLIADVAGGQMRYANAGHPHPFHLQRRAGRADSLPFQPGSGPALGLLDDAVYATSRCALEPDDVVVLFTDGLFEVTRADDEEYGRERLLAAVRERILLPPAKLFDEIVADILKFSGGCEFSDDVCLLGMDVMQVGTIGRGAEGA